MRHKGLIELPELSVESWRVFHRPRRGRGVRWKLVGSAATHAGAVALIHGPGDWWLSSRPDASETEATGESTGSSESCPETP
jgi:hypothetical protein